MKKICLFLLLWSVSLHATFLDEDMDGVANVDDHCPNSQFTDIVDEKGCVVEKVTFKEDHHFDVTLGYTYTKVDSNSSQNSQSLSFGYYYGDFSAWLYTSNYDLSTGESGLDDTTLALYYQWTYSEYRIKTGVGSYIPSNTQNGDIVDYFITAKAIRYLDLYDFSAEYQHTFMRDDATIDSDRLTLSTGYTLTYESYLSLSYTQQSSIYESENNLQNLSFYASYLWEEQWLLSADLSKVLNKSDTEISTSFNVGYFY